MPCWELSAGHTPFAGQISWENSAIEAAYRFGLTSKTKAPFLETVWTRLGKTLDNADGNSCAGRYWMGKVTYRIFSIATFYLKLVETLRQENSSLFLGKLLSLLLPPPPSSSSTSSSSTILWQMGTSASWGKWLYNPGNWESLALNHTRVHFCNQHVIKLTKPDWLFQHCI